MIHRLQQRQLLRATIEECWLFFSDPRNLAKITPKELDFQTVSDLPEEIHPGLMIEYRVRPLFGIAMSWLTEITHVERLRFFVDEQRVGPYRIWHHEHHFRDAGGGQVEVFDHVTYQLPLTPFSEIVHPLLVAPQLKKIFDYRDKAVKTQFGV